MGVCVWDRYREKKNYIPHKGELILHATEHMGIPKTSSSPARSIERVFDTRVCMRMTCYGRRANTHVVWSERDLHNNDNTRSGFHGNSAINKWHTKTAHTISVIHTNHINKNNNNSNMNEWCKEPTKKYIYSTFIFDKVEFMKRTLSVCHTTDEAPSYIMQYISSDT